MAIDPNTNPGTGIAFSPIPAEKTLEDLPALLARIFGGPSGGLLTRLPGLNVKGAPPDEILRAFLAGLPGGAGTRPDIGEVISPERPLMPGPGGAPDVGIGPAPEAPQVYAPPTAPGVPEVGGPGAPEPVFSIPEFPGGPEPAVPIEETAAPAPAGYGDVKSPGEEPSGLGPSPFEGVKGGPSAPNEPAMSPEERAFLEELFGAQPSMGAELAA